MKTHDLQPIAFSDDYENVEDVLAGTEEQDNVYGPEIACAGVGGAACKEGCVSGCKNGQKKGNDCTKTCKPGCAEGCKESCYGGCKGSNKEGEKCKGTNKDGTTNTTSDN